MKMIKVYDKGIQEYYWIQIKYDKDLECFVIEYI